MRNVEQIPAALTITKAVEDHQFSKIDDLLNKLALTSKEKESDGSR